MNDPLRMRFLAFFLLLVLTAEFAQAGPWPRSKGAFFTSTGVEVWEAEDGLPARYASGFVEYGLTEKLSLGANVAQGTFSGTDVELFLGVGVLQTGPHAVSVEVSVTNNFVTDTLSGAIDRTPGASLGLAYGRGLQIWERNAWTTLEFKYHRTEYSHLLKIDATFGVTFASEWKAMAQVFSSHSDQGWAVNLAPGIVIPVLRNQHIELGLRVPTEDIELSRIKIGLWQEF